MKLGLSDILIVVLVGLCIWLYLRKDPETPNDSELLNRIKDQELIISSLDSQITKKDLEYQILKASKDSLRIVYKTKLVFIERANVRELDSIIRLSWKK